MTRLSSRRREVAGNAPRRGARRAGFHVLRLIGAAATLFAAAAAALPAEATPATGDLRCDSSISAQFRPDANTRVLVVRAFRKGDSLPNPTLQRVFDSGVNPVGADLCMVKLLIGPGSPGAADAPSTSAGIIVEIWLPAKSAWNERIHAIGGGGWTGSDPDPGKILDFTAASDGRAAPTIAAEEGAVVSSTDTGHASPVTLGGSFLMKPDGTINTALWEDYAVRSVHAQAVATKALATAYYGRPARFAYWDGGSTGGRQGLALAQRYPADFDGIVIGYPAINFTKVRTADLYPQIVIQRDLGGRFLSHDQLTLVSTAAIAACDTVGGKHLGFILHPERCRYDPTRDHAVLCPSDGGGNGTPACVTRLQARAVNKIWYGMTVDGSVPDPALDNGFGPLDERHKWYGPSRGSNLALVASETPFSLAIDMVALELQNPRLGTPMFRNATGDGADGWRSLDYADLARAFDAGVALQPAFGHVNTDNPDLSAFAARGGKLLQFHGNSDVPTYHAGSLAYYDKVIARSGGVGRVQAFYRMYLIPGMGHAITNGTANVDANPPARQPLKGEFYQLLTRWVEQGVSPKSIILTSVSDVPLEKSLPICLYPSRISFVSGSPFAAASYACR